jgi:hypothetical protein
VKRRISSGKPAKTSGAISLILWISTALLAKMMEFV